MLSSGDDAPTDPGLTPAHPEAKRDQGGSRESENTGVNFDPDRDDRYLFHLGEAINALLGDQRAQPPQQP